jgi:hypothetical protein
METPTRWTRLPTHVSAHYPSWSSPHSHWSATGPRDQHIIFRPENAAENQSLSLQTNTGQTGEHHRSDRSLLVRVGNFHYVASHRSGRCNTPVRPVQAWEPPNHHTGLPTSKLTQTRNSGNTGQQQTHPDVHPSKTHQGLHRSERSRAPIRPV